MKLARIRKDGVTVPAIVVSESKILDCSSIAGDWDGAFYEGGGLEKLEADLESLVERLPEIAVEDVEYDSAISRPGKIVCIGLNYSDHAKETGNAVPEEPVIFMKSASALSGPNDPVRKPRNSNALDWEVELGVVIAKRTRYLDSADDAMSHIAGYTIANDVSERSFQLERGGQWTKGKSHDTFCPVGPWVVTTDEVRDHGSLKMQLSVNGQLRQDGSTSTMIFSVPEIVHHLSQFMTLEAGDLIITGTPPGVAMGIEPPPWLQVGDEMSLSIEGLGAQTQTVISDE